MASTITNPSANANTRSRRKRTRETVDEETPNSPSAIKRPKKEAKLDKLKAQLIETTVALKEMLKRHEEHLVNDLVAKEGSGGIYTNLIVACDVICMGILPDEDVLAILRDPFVDFFQPEEVLRNRLSGGMLPSEG